LKIINILPFISTELQLFYKPAVCSTGKYDWAKINKMTYPSRNKTYPVIIPCPVFDLNLMLATNIHALPRWTDWLKKCLKNSLYLDIVTNCLFIFYPLITSEILLFPLEKDSQFVKKNGSKLSPIRCTIFPISDSLCSKTKVHEYRVSIRCFTYYILVFCFIYLFPNCPFGDIYKYISPNNPLFCSLIGQKKWLKIIPNKMYNVPNRW
jgi:hypothetical protein